MQREQKELKINLKMQSGQYKQLVDQKPISSNMYLYSHSEGLKSKQKIQSIYPFKLSEAVLSDTKACSSVGKSDLSEGSNNMTATSNEGPEYDMLSQ